MVGGCECVKNACNVYFGWTCGLGFSGCATIRDKGIIFHINHEVWEWGYFLQKDLMHRDIGKGRSI